MTWKKKIVSTQTAGPMTEGRKRQKRDFCCTQGHIKKKKTIYLELYFLDFWLFVWQCWWCLDTLILSHRYRKKLIFFTHSLVRQHNFFFFFKLVTHWRSNLPVRTTFCDYLFCSSISILLDMFWRSWSKLKRNNYTPFCH